MGAMKQALLEAMEEQDEIDSLEECESCGRKNVNPVDMPYEGGAPVFLICAECRDEDAQASVVDDDEQPDRDDEPWPWHDEGPESSDEPECDA